MSNNKIDFVDTTISFEYDEALVVEAISPRLGIYTGGTIVTLVISNLDENDRVYCKFEDVVVNGVNLGSNLAKCISPAWTSPQNIVQVSVSNNNADFFAADETFLYHDGILSRSDRSRRCTKHRAE